MRLQNGAATHTRGRYCETYKQPPEGAKEGEKMIDETKQADGLANCDDEKITLERELYHHLERVVTRDLVDSGFRHCHHAKLLIDCVDAGLATPPPAERVDRFVEFMTWNHGIAVKLAETGVVMEFALPGTGRYSTIESGLWDLSLSGDKIAEIAECLRRQFEVIN
jgi:hypothetical protein